MNIHKQVATTAALLMLFATVGAGIVGLMHDSTIEKIKYNERMTLLKKLNTILPANRYDNDLLQDTVQVPPDQLLGNSELGTAYRARLQGKPVAVVIPAVAPNGYNGPIDILVGVYTNGTLAGVRVVKHRETPGLGDAIEDSRSHWILGFDGKSLTNPYSKQWKVKRDGGVFDQFTGATITPRAVVKAVQATLVYFNQHREYLFAPDDSVPHEP